MHRLLSNEGCHCVHTKTFKITAGNQPWQLPDYSSSNWLSVLSLPACPSGSEIQRDRTERRGMRTFKNNASCTITRYGELFDLYANPCWAWLTTSNHMLLNLVTTPYATNLCSKQYSSCSQCAWLPRQLVMLLALADGLKALEMQIQHHWLWPLDART